MEADKQVEVVIPQGNSGGSGAKKWLIGGCGCLSLIVVVCGIGIYFTWGYFQPMVNFVFECQDVVETSPIVKQELGEPITVGPPSQEAVNRDITLRFPVTGSEKKGTVVFEATIGDDLVPTLNKSYLELEDGTQVSIDPDEATTFDIEGLDGL